MPGTPRLLRALNDRAALELLLAKGPLTRAQLGELTGLSKVTASQLVERLEERGLVTRVGEQAGGRGPNAQMYAVVPATAYVVGVDVAPQHVVAATVDITGTIGGRVDVAIGDADDPVRVVHAAVVEAAAAAGAPLNRVRRVVLGTPAWSTRAPARSPSPGTCRAGTAACSARCAPTSTGRSSSRTT